MLRQLIFMCILLALVQTSFAQGRSPKPVPVPDERLAQIKLDPEHMIQTAGVLDYTYTTISVPGSDQNVTYAFGLNNFGDVVGVYYQPYSRGFLLSKGVITTIDFPGAMSTAPWGINDAGQITGYYQSADSAVHGFLYNNGTFTSFDVPNGGEGSTVATGINNLSQIVGSDGNGLQGFLYQDGLFSILDFPGAKTSSASGVNNSGKIVGYWYDGSIIHGFLYDGRSYTSFTVPGAMTTFGIGINDFGDSAGYSYDNSNVDHGFIYSGGVISTTDFPGANLTQLTGINNTGQIVGTVAVPSCSRCGFLGTLPAGPKLVLNPTTLAFPSQVAGTRSAPQAIILTNDGSNAISISSVIASGNFLQQNNCGTTVGPGGSCVVKVVFKPNSRGFKSGTVAITDNASDSPQIATLSGAATVVSFTPTNLDFGSVKMGTTVSAPITMANVSRIPLTVGSISLRGPDLSDFQQTNNCFPGLPGKGSCTFTVTFTPTAKGARSGKIVVNDSGGGSPQIVSLAGTGS